MATPYNVDEKLFTRSNQDGEYSTWNHLFTRDFGVGANLTLHMINNLGTTLIEDFGAFTLNRVDINNILLAYAVFWSPFHNKIYSDTYKYYIDDVFAGAGIPITIIRDGLVYFQRNVALDALDILGISTFSISPSGQYFLVTCTSIASANVRYLLVYGGE